MNFPRNYYDDDNANCVMTLGHRETAQMMTMMMMTTMISLMTIMMTMTMTTV